MSDRERLSVDAESRVSASLANDGLICGFEFGPGAANRAIELENLAVTPEALGVVWMHFNINHAGAHRWLSRNTAFPPAFRDALERHEDRSRLEPSGEGLLVVANDFAFDAAADSGEVAVLWSYATPGMLVTARSHPLRSLDRLRAAAREGLRVESGLELLAKLFEYQIEALEDLLAQANRTVNRIEDQILGGRISEQREHLGQARRLCAHLRRHFSPQRAAMRKFLAHPPAWLHQSDVMRLQRSEEDLGGLIDDASELHERVSLLQDELASRLSEQTNRNLYVLTIITAVFLPMNLITGIFGMNVAGLPGTGDAASFSFWWVMLLIAVAAVVTVLALRLRKLL